jgi:uncharacterized protein (DUF1015 family)
LLPLSEHKVLAFDRYRNALLLERSRLVNDDQKKTRLELTGGIGSGEEITRAIFGDLNIGVDLNQVNNDLLDHEGAAS